MHIKKSLFLSLVFLFIFTTILSPVQTAADTQNLPLPEPIIQLSKNPTREDVIAYSRAQASAQGLNPDLVERIIFCESGYQTEIKNPNSSATGEFQFLTSTWIATRNQMGLNSDLSLRLLPDQNILTGIWKIKNGGISAWDASKSCWKQ